METKKKIALFIFLFFIAMQCMSQSNGISMHRVPSGQRVVTMYDTTYVRYYMMERDYNRKISDALMLKMQLESTKNYMDSVVAANERMVSLYSEAQLKCDSALDSLISIGIKKDYLARSMENDINVLQAETYKQKKSIKTWRTVAITSLIAFIASISL